LPLQGNMDIDHVVVDI